jgi:hypothetical protein
MKFLLILIILCTGCSSTRNYVKVGAGYKFNETSIDFYDGASTSPISARIEAGQHNGAWSYGISHHSQWLRGWPVNNNTEYYKTELFIDYEWEF